MSDTQHDLKIGMLPIHYESELKNRIEALESENAELRKDKERLDWIEDNYGSEVRFYLWKDKAMLDFGLRTIDTNEPINTVRNLIDSELEDAQ